MRFQSHRQKQYEFQYGSYFALADGTYGTNKYGMTIFRLVTMDCLEYIQLFGLLTGLSENTVDDVAAGHLFGIASVSTTQHIRISSIILLSCFNVVIVICILTVIFSYLEQNKYPTEY